MNGVLNNEASNRGYTLVEAVVALGIFMAVAVFSVNLLSFAARVSAKLTVEAELTENARIAMDMITAHIRQAEEIGLATEGAGTLKELATSIRKGNTVHIYKFTYNSNLSQGQARFHRIDFGGNELASYISDISMVVDGDILRIMIKTDESIGSGMSVQPVVLYASISLRYKRIEVAV